MSYIDFQLSRPPPLFLSLCSGGVLTSFHGEQVRSRPQGAGVWPCLSPPDGAEDVAIPDVQGSRLRHHVCFADKLWKLHSEKAKKVGATMVF